MTTSDKPLSEAMMFQFAELPLDRDYRKTSSISRTKSQNLIVSNLVVLLSLLNPLKPGVKSREWRCSWSSADRRCSNYIWVVDNFIAYQGVTYIRGFTVVINSLEPGDTHIQADPVCALFKIGWHLQNFPGPVSFLIHQIFHNNWANI